MSVDAAWEVLRLFSYVVLGYFVLLNAGYLITSFYAFGALTRHARRMKAMDVSDLIEAAGAPPVTLIAPAFNEERTCVQAVRALLALEYPSFEVVVVSDGSTDATLARLVGEFDLEPAIRSTTARIPTAPVHAVYRSRIHPHLWVVDKENGGKADALNVGINHCRTPLFCAMDADSLLERKALVRIVRPFLEDSRTVAAGGLIRIANGCTVERGMIARVGLPRSWLARFQVLEYLRAFLSGRMGWDALDATLVISGAFGIFRRSVVVDAGGYASRWTSGETVGEDMELVVRLHRHCRERMLPYRIAFVPDPVAWTECPESLRTLGRQRDRWQRGLVDSLSRHRRMLFHPAYGRIGFFAFPFFYFLEMFGPIVEILGYVVFGAMLLGGRAGDLYVVAFLSVAFFLGLSLSISAVGLEEITFRRYPRRRDLLHLFGLAVLENFGFRQMVSLWRLRGIFSSLLQIRRWGRMERRGFSDPGGGGERASGAAAAGGIRGSG